MRITIRQWILEHARFRIDRSAALSDRVLAVDAVVRWRTGALEARRIHSGGHTSAAISARTHRARIETRRHAERPKCVGRAVAHERRDAHVQAGATILARIVRAGIGCGVQSRASAGAVAAARVHRWAIAHWAGTEGDAPRQRMAVCTSRTVRIPGR